jgi:FAD/FMN-containing dehydrogenase
MSTLSPNLGYACDNILSMNVVTADGRLVKADEREQPDLFWAMRGAGANFGIATMLEFRLSRIEAVLSGSLRYPLQCTKRVLSFVDEYVQAKPQDLFLGISILPHQSEDAIEVKVVWVGDRRKGELALAPLRRHARPVQDSITWKPYADEQRAGWEMQSAALASHRRAGHFYRLSEELAETIKEKIVNTRQRNSAITMMNWHGRWSSESNLNAFGFRKAGFEFWIDTHWQSGDDWQRSWQWVEKVYEAIEPFSSGAVYVNDLEDEGPERVRAAYGVHYERLAQIKWEYDPQNFFRMNQNIVPQSPVG